MNIRTKVSQLLNGIVRRTEWYNNVIFPDCRKFWQHEEMNLDVVNLGSSSGKWDFCYSGLKIKAANWAMAPQSFVGDLAILQNYCSYLRPKATVIIPLCPFSSLGGGNDYFPDKYYSIIRLISIPHASQQKKQEVLRIQYSPLHYFPAIRIFTELRSMYLRTNHEVDKRLFQQDAQRWMMSWKKEFSITDFHNPLSLVNQDRVSDSAQALRKLIVFCLNHGFRPILVLPPMSKALSNMFDFEMRAKYISNLVNSVQDLNITYFDYMDMQLFIDCDLYFNSYILNKKGAILFTKQVLIDCGFINS